jgi:hypothetical protein
MIGNCRVILLYEDVVTPATTRGDMMTASLETATRLAMCKMCERDWSSCRADRLYVSSLDRLYVSMYSISMLAYSLDGMHSMQHAAWLSDVRFARCVYLLVAM